MSYFSAALRAPSMTTFMAPSWIFSPGNDLNISSVNSVLNLLPCTHMYTFYCIPTFVGQVDVMLHCAPLRTGFSQDLLVEHDNQYFVQCYCPGNFVSQNPF